MRWLLAVFACYRLASLVSREEGPYLPFWRDARQTGVFERLRLQAGVNDYGPDGRAETNLARGLACPLCVGAYLSALMLALAARPSRAGDLILGWLGISGAQAFLMRLTGEGG